MSNSSQTNNLIFMCAFFSSLSFLEDGTVEKILVFNISDTIYGVLAVLVLIIAFLMFCISYVCLRNVFLSNKKLLKDSLLKIQHQEKNLIVPEHLICKTMPEVYV